MFRGSLVALITPFRSGKVDETAFQEHVAWQVGQGTHGFVPCGTTGESPALNDGEARRVIALCVEVAKGRAPVIAGTGTNSTEHTIALTRQAKEAGADAALIVCPYYNKPTQEGLYQHFKAVHDAVDLPIVVYNIPGRSAVDMTNATMARLAKLPNIVGVKDATNDLARPLRMRVEIGKGFALLSGEDATAVAYLASDPASYVSGSTLFVDDGWTAVDGPPTGPRTVSPAPGGTTNGPASSGMAAIDSRPASAERVVQRAEGDASRFIQEEEAFRTAPGPTETRLYLETMEQVLPGKKKLIVDSGKGRRHLLLLEDGVEIAPPGAAILGRSQ